MRAARAFRDGTAEIGATLAMIASLVGCARPAPSAVPRPALADETGVVLPELPAPPAGRMRVRAIASGLAHTCALGDAGRIVCWGEGATGKKTPDDVDRPSYVEHLKRGAVGLEAGGGRTCARFVDGSRSCWAPREVGRLTEQPGGTLFLGSGVSLMVHGSGAVLLELPHPAAVDGVAGWRDTRLIDVPSLAGATLAAGTGNYLLAAMADGSLWCSSARPGVFICPGETNGGWSRARGVDARQLAVADSSFCVLRGAGDVVCTVGGPSSPARAVGYGTALAGVALPGSATAISGGFRGVCALLRDHSVWCWEANWAPVAALADAVRVELPTKIVALSSGFAHHCALDEEGDVWCWGENRWGALGPGTHPDQRGPTRVRILP